MRIAVKQNPIGKPQNNFNARQITFGWNNTDMSSADVVAHIVSGMPFAVAHFQDGHRKSANFISSECIALDADGIFDDRLNATRPFTAAEYFDLLQHPVITQYAFAVIQSYSSKAGAYKCRILFQLSESINDAKDYKALVSTLMALVPFIDPAPKDAARAFFGGQPGRPPDFINYDNILDVAWLRRKRDDLQQQKQRHIRPPRLNTTLPDDVSLDQIREALRHIPPRLHYEEWLAILMAIHSAFPGAAGVALAEEWSPGYEGEIARKFASFTENQVTLGTLFFYALQYGYRFPDIPVTGKRKAVKPEILFAELVERLTRFAGITFTADERLHLRYMPDQIMNHRTILIKSPIGTGKTELLKKMVQKKKRVLVIVHRQALARSLSERLSQEAAEQTARHLNLPCYSDLSDEQLANADRVVICLNSLPRVVGKSGLKAYDLVALDELIQQIEHLGGDTFSSREALDAYKCLKAVMRGAEQVIGMDAGMNDLAADWVHEIRGDAYCIENTYRVERGELTLYQKSERVIKEALRAVKKGNIAIACGLARSEALRLQFAAVVGEKNVRVINHKNSLSRDTQDFLSTMNESPLPRVLIYTPSLGTGFDITQPVRAVFGIFEGTWFTAPDVLQMLGRCRNTQHTHVYIPLVMHGTRLEDWHDIFQYDRDAAHLTALEGDFDEHGVFVTSPAQDSLSKLLAIFDGERNRSKNNLLAHFVTLVQQTGYTLQVNDQGSPITRRAMNAARDAYQEAHKALVLASEPVDDVELDWHKQQDRLTPEIWAGNDRYHIEQVAGIDAIEDQNITPQMYDDLYEPRQREALRIFTDLRTHEKILQHEDRYEAREYTLQAKRKHRAKRAKLIRSLLKAVFEVDHVEDLQHLTEPLPADVIVERVRQWMQMHGEQIPLYFDRRKERSDRPLAVLRWVLARIGLKLNRERVRDGDRLFYHYWLDEKLLARWLSYSDKRFAALQKQYADVPLPTSYASDTTAETGTDPPEEIDSDGEATSA